ncbi:SDR family oxidoreductase [Herbiconiux sp. A18JL235]|uniref:SDR family oxidoreductase n=1 Tax=Herbiconiux sp. A18JL235 TaxID=3152363 RepID=A0AB39BJM1_9MICO
MSHEVASLETLSGMRAVVVGGASGMGLALARALVGRDARVMIGDIETGALDAAAAEIGVGAAVVDVSNRSSTAHFAGLAAAELGGVDLVITTAGVAMLGSLSDTERSDWDWLISVNLFGTINIVDFFVPHLRRTTGRLLITGSVAGVVPEAGMGAYAATKAAVGAYAEVLTEELAVDGIAVTLFLPGPVATRLGSSDRNRRGRPVTSRQETTSPDISDRRWISADDAAANALQALASGVALTTTHPEWREQVVSRHRRIEKSFD